MPLPHDFKEFLQLLNSEKIEYLIVGGYAVAFHGYPRPTGDLDIWVAVSPANSQKIAAVLQRFGFAAASPSIFAQPGKVVRMGVPPVRLEILTAISGVEFQACFNRRVAATLDGIPANIIARDDLIQNKRAARRHKDLNDVDELERRSRPS